MCDLLRPVLMSLTLDRRPPSQPALLCMPHQRGKTEYTGFSLDLSHCCSNASGDAS